MIKPASLQIQAVLYKNEPKELIRALESLVNAIRHDKENNQLLGNVCFCWGDASPEPIFAEAEIDALNQRLGDLVEVTYTYFNENTGYGKGHNLLASACGSDYLMIENPDIMVAGDYFYHMLTPFADTKVGLTEARQTPIEHPKYYDEQTLEAAWASGACFIISTALYQKLGGFDTDSFFMYSEDVDLSLRIRREGKKLIYQPAAPVYHSKHLTENAHLKVTATELRYSPEAQLVLAYKWNNQPLLNRLLSAFESGDKIQREAVAAFHQRVKDKKIKPIRKGSRLYQEKDFENRFVL
jgi:GT2 family glycosyltransferase